MPSLHSVSGGLGHAPQSASQLKHASVALQFMSPHTETAPLLELLLAPVLLAPVLLVLLLPDPPEAAELLLLPPDVLAPLDEPLPPLLAWPLLPPDAPPVLLLDELSPPAPAPGVQPIRESATDSAAKAATDWMEAGIDMPRTLQHTPRRHEGAPLCHTHLQEHPRLHGAATPEAMIRKGRGVEKKPTSIRYPAADAPSA